MKHTALVTIAGILLTLSACTTETGRGICEFPEGTWKSPDTAEKGLAVFESKKSKWVYPDKSGRLVYKINERGDRIPDFSYAGYHSGEKAIPDVPVKKTLSPGGSDDTQTIQAALDEVGRLPMDSDGLRGALLLKKGQYRIGGRLFIRSDGVVLRGEGEGEDGTVLIATGFGKKENKRDLITVGKDFIEPDIQHEELNRDESSRREIIDSYVPIGARQFTVASAEGYAPGDRIIVFRPSTKEWIHFIGCDQIPPRWAKVKDTCFVNSGGQQGFHLIRENYSQTLPKAASETWDEFVARINRSLRNNGTEFDLTQQWVAGEYDMPFERRIVAMDGSRITIDAPLVHPLEQRFGGGAIFHYSTPGRVFDAGIENLRLMSEFGPVSEKNPYGPPDMETTSELHGWTGIALSRYSENTWVRNVTGNYFGFSLVSVFGIRATVQDCTNLGHAAPVEGGRRYSFMVQGQMDLVQRCFTADGRHEFDIQARALGPNAFVDCIGLRAMTESGPHHRYAVGSLYDNVSSEMSMESCWHGNAGSGHGWTGTQTLFYNCTAPGFDVEAPPGGISWVIGSGPEKNSRVQPPSLYYQQLRERLGEAALNRIVSPEQLRTIGRYKWVNGFQDKK